MWHTPHSLHTTQIMSRGASWHTAAVGRAPLGAHHATAYPVVSGGRAALRAIGPAAVAMAEAEGLPAHARSVDVRF